MTCLPCSSSTNPSTAGGNTASDATFKILLRSAELMWEVNTYAYQEGHIIPEATEVCERHAVQDIGQGNERCVCARYLNEAYDRLLYTLLPHTEHSPLEAEEIDNHLWAPEHYQIILQDLSEWKREGLHLIRSLCSKYMVYYTMAEWMRIVKPSVYLSWKERADEVLKEIEDCRNSQPTTLTRPSRPF